MYLEGTLYLWISLLEKRRGYTTPWEWGGILHLWVGIRTLPLFSNSIRSKNPPPPMHMYRFTIAFTSCFMVGEAHRWGTYPKWGGGLNYHLILGPLSWEYASTLGLYPTLILNLAAETSALANLNPYRIYWNIFVHYSEKSGKKDQCLMVFLLQ